MEKFGRFVAGLTAAALCAVVLVLDACAVVWALGLLRGLLCA